MCIVFWNVFLKFLLDCREFRVSRFLRGEIESTVMELVNFIVYSFSTLSLMTFLIWEEVVEDLYRCLMFLFGSVFWVHRY